MNGDGYMIETFNVQPALDTDNDGIKDNIDQCDNTTAGLDVDANGCADAQKDSDGDGITDNIDMCDNAPGIEVTANGCPVVDTSDNDGDGIQNDLDLCQNTASLDVVNANGCSAFDRGALNYQETYTCAKCHGTEGQGGKSGGPINGLCGTTNCQDISQLALYLSDYMPYGAPEQCIDSPSSSCASDVATYMVKAFAAKNIGDDDNDGVYNEDDQCAGTDPSETKSVDSTGCPSINPVNIVNYAINAGGASYVAQDGTEYQEDSYFSGGTIYKSTSSISGTQDQTLHQSERSGKTVTYALSLVPGEYVVELMFAEIYHELANKRLFDVLIEGQVILNDFDIANVAGKNVAVIETIPIDLFDNELNIVLNVSKDNAQISAIRVLKTSNDGDDDGVNDTLDSCPGTLNSALIDNAGCSEIQLDKDRDGVVSGDVCPDTPVGESVNSSGAFKGCSVLQIAPDEDNDGISDIIDLCKETEAGSNVGSTGCSGHTQLSSERKTSPLFRLTDTEYRNSVQTAFNLTELPPFNLPIDNSEGVFRNNSVDPIGGFEQYITAAETIAQVISTKLEGLCDWQATPKNCIRNHLLDSIRLLYSGQQVDNDIETLEQVMLGAFNEGATNQQALYAALVRVLVDDRLLFRIEQGSGLDSNMVSELTPQESAIRLAYLLNDSVPDNNLLTLAEQGALTDEQVLEHAERLMTDPKYNDVVWEFFAQWLGVPKDSPPKGLPIEPIGDQCNSTNQCKNTYGVEATDCSNSSAANSICMCETKECWTLTGSESIEYSRWNESKLFIDHVISSGKWSEVFTANYSFINDKLATLYGVEKPTTNWERYEFPSSAKRQGVLTHASFLTQNGKEEVDVSWIFRGKVVYENLFCEHLPPPPPESADTIVVSREETAPCSGCHLIVDPIGRIFDAYDSHGALRDDTYLTNGGLTIGTDIDGDYADAVAFSQALGDSESLGRCLTQMWYRFSIGRTAFDVDEQSYEASYEALKANGHFGDLVKSFVTSDSFNTIVSDDKTLQCTP